jgi:hypothetical protein
MDNKGKLSSLVGQVVQAEDPPAGENEVPLQRNYSSRAGHAGHAGYASHAICASCTI